MTFSVPSPSCHPLLVFAGLEFANFRLTSKIFFLRGAEAQCIAQTQRSSTQRQTTSWKSEGHSLRAPHSSIGIYCCATVCMNRLFVHSVCLSGHCNCSGQVSVKQLSNLKIFNMQTTRNAKHRNIVKYPETINWNYHHYKNSIRFLITHAKHISWGYANLVVWFARIDSRDSRKLGDSRESEIRLIQANRPDAL